MSEAQDRTCNLIVPSQICFRCATTGTPTPLFSCLDTISDDNFDVIPTLVHLQRRVPPSSLSGFLQDFFFDSLNILYLVVVFCFFFFKYSSCLVFPDLPKSVLWCLSLILENAWALFLQIFLLFLSLFLLFLAFPGHICYIFHNGPTVHEHCSIFFFFCLFISFCSVSMKIS